MCVVDYFRFGGKKSWVPFQGILKGIHRATVVNMIG